MRIAAPAYPAVCQSITSKFNESTQFGSANLLILFFEFALKKTPSTFLFATNIFSDVVSQGTVDLYRRKIIILLNLGKTEMHNIVIRELFAIKDASAEDNVLL